MLAPPAIDGRVVARLYAGEITDDGCSSAMVPDTFFCIMTGLEISNPRLRRLYETWLEKQAGKPYPARSDFDPVNDLRFILGNLMLVDVVGGDPPDFRIRLHGSSLVVRHGYELTGKMLDELPIPEQRDRARQTFSTVVATGEPLHSNRDQLFGDRLRRYEAIVLPLSNNGATVDMLLVGLIHHD